MKFPVTIRHRSAKAKVYAPANDFPYYRVSYSVGGSRRMLTFPAYSEAKAAAERIVRELASGSPSVALTASQSRDALAALERLQEFHRATGRAVSLLGAASEFVEAAGKLGGRTLAEAVDGYLRTVVTVQRKDIGEATSEFIASRQSLTKAGPNGERAQLSPKYAYNLEIQLRRFADAFPGTAISDLGREHLDTFFGALGDFSAKSRNHHRAAVRMFLDWAVRKDYLPTTHRLGEADQMRPERADAVEIEFYTTGEFRALLHAAEDPLQVMIAIGGLAGLRTAELLRLDWADVWRVPGHIEITARKAKTRQRRLVETGPALASWLAPFAGLKSGPVWPQHEITFQQKSAALCEAAGVKRKPNGLRHAFCTYHFALHANENLTAALAGNSPAMIHAHYKGLATKAEAEKWFTVLPPAAASNVVPLGQRASA